MIFSNFAEAYDVVRHLSKNEKTMAGLHFDITGDNSNLLCKLQESERAIKAVSKTVEKEGGNIEDLFNRLARSAAAIGVGFSAKEFISKAAQVRGEFQKLEVAFTTMLGSKEQAEKLMEQMVRTAATTPFSLQDVAGGAKQLLAYGIEAERVNETLIRLGDIAAGLSIPLGDLVYLYGTTRAQGRLYTEDFNQFTSRGIPMIEMLADKFGVAESEVMGLVEAGKVGFPEVQEVIEKLTNEGGKFGGLMEAQSKTIAGQISNIEDAIETMFNDIGKANEGVINEALSGVSYLVENYEKVGREVLAVAAAYGTYKAVLMSVAAYQSVMVGVTYSTEIAELSKLIPLKQQSANEDIIAAVAAGRLTTAKAEQVIAIRTEIEAKRSSMQATLADAKANTAAAQAAYKSALQRSIASKQAYAAKLKELEASKAYYANEALYNAAKTQQLSALADERSAAAKAKKVAAQNLEIARSKQNVAATALETFNTQANTAAQTANARSTNLLTVAKTKLAAASKALGLSMLANPYVVAAAAVATLTYGIYKLATADTAAEKAAKRHREEREKYVKVLDERREKIEQLIRVIQDETETEYTQIAAYEQLALLSPALVKSYTREELAVASLTETTKKLNKERDEADYQNIVANVDKYSTAIKGARAEAERLREEAKRETDPEKASHLNYLAIGQDMSANKSEEILKLWMDDLEEANRLRKKAEEDNKPIKIRLLEAGSARDEIVQELNAAKLELQEWQEKIKESPFMTIPFDVQIRFNNAQSKLKEIDETITNLQGQAGGEESNYQQDYDAAKKAWDEAKKKLEEIEKDKKAFTSKQYEDAKTDYSDKKKKYESLGGITSDKAINDAKKQAEEQKKLQQELYETLIQLRFQNQQDEINLMEEGSEKKRRQIELDYQKDIDAYNKAKAKYGETDEVKAMKSNADNRRSEGLAAINEEEQKKEQELMKAQEDAWNEALIKFGNYNQKRKAIIEKYDKEIAQAQNAGEEWVKIEKKKAALEELDEQYGKSTRAMADLFEDAGEKSVTAIQGIIDKYETLVKYLSGTEQSDGTPVTLDELKAIGFTDKDIESIERGEIRIRDITDALMSLNGELEGKSPWMSFVNDMQKSIGKIKSAEGDTEKIGDGVMGIGNAVSDFAPALGEFAEGIGGIFGVDGEKIQSIVGSIQGLGQTATGVGQILSGDIVGGAMSAVGGISKVVSSLEGLFGADYSEYENMKAQYDTLISVWDTLIGKKTEYIDIDYGVEAQKAADEAAKLVDVQIQRQRQLAKMLASSGSSVGSHSLAYRVNDRMSSSDWRSLSALVGQRVGSLQDVLNLDADVIGKVLQDEHFVSVLTTVNSDFIEYIQNIEKYGEQLEEIAEKEREAVTGIGFDAFKDGYLDMLSDLESTNEDFADDFEKNLQNAIFSALVANKYSDRIKSLYEDWAKAGEYGLTSREAEELRREQQQIIEDMLADREQLMEDFGWSSSSGQQSASGRGFGTEMTHEDAGELSGRFTALYEVGLQILQNISVLQSISVSAQSSDTTLLEIKNLMILSNGHLEDISLFTKKILEGFGKKLDDINNNIKNVL